ncbi:MAG: hypothetical protein ACI8QC_000301 [Planctomycetota bacterium]|jgi:hypothetical protein
MNQLLTQHSRLRRNSGSILTIALLMVIGISGLTIAVVSTHHSAGKQTQQADREIRLRFIAEAGIAESIAGLQGGYGGTVGSEKVPAMFGQSPFYVSDIDLGSNVHRIISTALDGRYSSSSEAIISVPPTTTFPFDKAVASKATLRIEGNVQLDSYDPIHGEYSDQLVGDYVDSNASIVSNDDVDLSANTEIYGTVTYGPDGDDSATTAATANVSDGLAQADESLVFPSIVVPEITQLAGITHSSGVLNLGPGDIGLENITIKNFATLNIVGPARVVVDDFMLKGGGFFNVDSTAGEVEIFVRDSFVLESNSNCTTIASAASNVRLNLLARHSEEFDNTPAIELNSNAEFGGTIYAPDASLVVDSNFEIFGAIAAKWVQLSSNTQFHFDESLFGAGGTGSGGLQVTAWRTVTEQQAETLRSGL